MPRKTATFHINCIHGTPVDFELYDDGEIVVTGIDMDTELASAEIGFDMSECAMQYIAMRDTFLSFVKRTIMNRGVLSNVNFYLDVSTVHMTSGDDITLTKKTNKIKDDGLYDASHLYFEPTQYGYIFYLDPSTSPKRIVISCNNKDGLSSGMIGVLQKAWDAGIWQVRFDADAERLDGEKTYAW